MKNKPWGTDRKKVPIFTGFIKYFPRAIQYVAYLSYKANEQHNKGQPVHWDMSKSTDELDAMMRHLTDSAMGIEIDDDDLLHVSKVAWRSMANLERTLIDMETVDKLKTNHEQ